MLTEFTFEYDGRTVWCRVESIHVNASGRPAIPSNAMWYYEIDGVTHSAYEASPDDIKEDVTQRIAAIEEARSAQKGIFAD